MGKVSRCKFIKPPLSTPLQHTAGHGGATRLRFRCSIQQATVVLPLQHTAGHGGVARLRCLCSIQQAMAVLHGCAASAVYSSHGCAA
jgi:hypothetical protein